MRKTKIVCTLGPATDDVKVMRGLINAGMNVARFNFSHGTHEEHLKRLKLVKRVRTELGAYVATMLDTKGPEIRIGTFKNGPINLKLGDKFMITARDVEGNQEQVSVLYKDFPREVIVGTRVLLNDGLAEMTVDSIDGEDVHLTVENNCVLSDHKSINLPDINVSMPFISDADMSDILFGIENEFDFIALSFTRNKDDVMQVRKLLEEHGSKMRIIAKIENTEGVEKIDEILEVVDAIMVARGDLGVEIPFTEMPKVQKDLIHKCYTSGKPAITATQMLESMVTNPRPTRAEVTDIANAIYDGTSAIMLSGETAAGNFPVRAVETMSAIAEATENSIDYNHELRMRSYADRLTITDSIAHSACQVGMDIGAKAIVTVTQTGYTSRHLSKYRPSLPIIGCTDTEQVCRFMALSWGVVPVLMSTVRSTDELIDLSIAAAQNKGLLEEGDLVVVTAGVPVGVSGSTNILKAHTVGKASLEGVWKD